jgi:hypothetical protein
MLYLPIHGAPRNVRYGSLADIVQCPRYVWLYPRTQTFVSADGMSEKCHFADKARERAGRKIRFSVR